MCRVNEERRFRLQGLFTQRLASLFIASTKHEGIGLRIEALTVSRSRSTGEQPSSLPQGSFVEASRILTEVNLSVPNTLKRQG
jgi:hypothetical protein